jgi:hypothetical protein
LRRVALSLASARERAKLASSDKAALGANQRRKDLWRADRDALALARAER